jgi:hypothetical protein
MSVRVMTWVWDHSPVGGTERLVLLAIADCAADDGTNAWPALSTLARKTLLDERTVRRIIRRLEDGGHLAVAVAAGPNGTNRYAVIMSGGTPGQSAPRSECPPGNSTRPPDTATPPPPGHSRAPRTSLNVPLTSKRASARANSSGRQPSAVSLSRGAALPPPSQAPERCSRHRGQYAGFCGPCRSEAVAAA